jgi:hypothetical protein
MDCLLCKGKSFHISRYCHSCYDKLNKLTSKENSIFYCPICQIKKLGDGYKLELGHITNHLNRCNGPDCHVRCEPCRLTLANDENYNKHILTKTHQIKLLKFTSKMNNTIN